MVKSQKLLGFRFSYFELKQNPKNVLTIAIYDKA